MSLRVTSICLREPMIRFKYAIAKNGGQALASPSAAASVRAGSAAFAQQHGARGDEPQVTYESFDELPAKFRPKILTDHEIETVLMGGVAPYVPKHLQKKKK